MAGDLVPRMSDSLPAGYGTTWPSRRSRAMAREVEEAAHRGVVRAARVQGAAYATHVALTQVGFLSAEEGRLAEMIPAADPIHRERVAARLRILVENYTAVAAAEIAGLGM